jgi:hypothetical protein
MRPAGVFSAPAFSRRGIFAQERRTPSHSLARLQTRPAVRFKSIRIAFPVTPKCRRTAVRDAENLIGSQVKWCRASVANLNVLRANGVQNVSQALFVTASRPGRLLAWGG